MAKVELQIIYKIDAQKTGGRFSIPKDAVRALGILDTKTDKLKTSVIHLKVEDEKGHVVFNYWMSLKSGTEIYGPEFKEIQPNQRIKVTIDLQPPPPKTIFISYAHSDWEQYVKPLVERLRMEDFDVWVDQYILETGDVWRDKIDTALKECERMILCITPEALSRPNVKLEYRYFLKRLDKGKTLFPLMFKETELPPQLEEIQYRLVSQVDTLINELKK